MIRFYSSAIAALALTIGSTEVRAQPLYSVDLATKHLVRIDTADASITDIGVLPKFNGTVLDMEFSGDRLFALANVSPNKVLMEIDPDNADILSMVTITIDGVPLTAVSEGMGAGSAGELYVSFDNSGMVGGTNSNHVGIVGLDGVMVDIRNVGRDCDGMGLRYAGRMWGLDRDPATTQNTIFTVSHEFSATVHINDLPFTAEFNGVDELVQTRRGLFAVDFLTKRLHRLDPVEATLQDSLPYDPAYTLVVLASPPPCAGDADGDGDRDFADITAVLTTFGLPTFRWGPGDADGDGDADFADITEILTLFGVPCYP